MFPATHTQANPLSRLGLGHSPTCRVIRRRFRFIKLIEREIEQNRAFDYFGQRAIQRRRDRDQDGCFVEVCAIGCPCVRISTEIYATRLRLLCCGDATEKEKYAERV